MGSARRSKVRPAARALRAPPLAAAGGNCVVCVLRNLVLAAKGRHGRSRCSAGILIVGNTIARPLRADNTVPGRPAMAGRPYNAAMVRKALELLITKTRDILYDVRHRVRTRGVVPVAELGLTRDSIQYEGIAPKTLRKALAALGPLDGYTFVDLGSGMGRAVLVASEFPFRRIVGVEIAPELHAIACSQRPPVSRAATMPRHPPGATGCAALRAGRRGDRVLLQLPVSRGLHDEGGRQHRALSRRCIRGGHSSCS